MLYGFNSAEKEADIVFERLRQSSAYVFAHEKLKRATLQKLWLFCVKTLFQRLRNEGMCGFGYLVEAFAKESSLLRERRNSPKAAYLESFFIECFQKDPYAIFGDGNARCNPDCIWFTITGRRATCTGIGEIKSSLGALSQKPEQLSYQEKNIRDLIVKLEKQKQRFPFLKKLNLTIADNFEQVIIIPQPSCHTPNLQTLLPPRWNILTFEWTYDELMFLARELCPEFRPEIVFTKNKYASYVAAVRQIFERVMLMTRTFFQDISLSEKAAEYVALCMTIFGKYPRNYSELVYLQTIFPSQTPTMLFRDYSDNPPALKRLSPEEEAIAKKLMCLGIRDAESLQFLSTRRRLRQTYRKKIGALLERLPPLNPFEYF